VNDCLLSTRGLATGYGGRRRRLVSRALDLEVKSGQAVSLVGPNGTGKTTLLRTLAGLLSPLEGEIFLAEGSLQQLTRRQRAQKIAVVLSGRISVGHLTVEQLVTLGRYPFTGIFGTLSAEDGPAIAKALQSVDGEGLRQRYVDELSDGEYQRVMIARALAQGPRIILLDEPAAFLDLMRRIELMHTLRELSRSASVSFVAATHDVDMAMSVSDRIWLMDAEGRVHCGAPEDHLVTGIMSRVFSSDMVRFDEEQAVFRRAEEGIVGRVELISHSSRRAAELWTLRALRRMGFSVSGKTKGPADKERRVSEKGRAALRIEVQDRSDGLVWILEHRREEKIEYYSIADLSEGITHLFHYVE
jgi:iron complex transport system ATP-binding protein